MKSSAYFFPTQRIKEGLKGGFGYLESAGYVTGTAKGCFTLLPLGRRMVSRIENIIRVACADKGFAEAYLPILQKQEWWEESGRIQKYADVLCRTTLNGQQEFIVNPTQEEAMLNLLRSNRLSSKAFPLRLYQISERVRNEIRPASDMVKSRAFLLADMYSFVLDMESAVQEMAMIDALLREILSLCGLPFKLAQHLPREVADRRSYWVPSEANQCKVFLCGRCRASFRGHVDRNLCPLCSNAEYQTIEAAEAADLAFDNVLAPALNVLSLDGRKIEGFALAGIGVSRMLQLLAEHHHDERGLVLPSSVAPFQAHIVSTPERRAESFELAAKLLGQGVEIITDDRDLPIGRQFIDADLIGIPLQIVLGNKIGNRDVKIMSRRTKETTSTSNGEAVQTIISLVQKERKGNTHE